MSTFEIRVVDPAREAHFKPWWAVAHEANSERPVDAYPGWEVTRSRLTAPDPEHGLLRGCRGAWLTMVNPISALVVSSREVRTRSTASRGGLPRVPEGAPEVGRAVLPEVASNV